MNKRLLAVIMALMLLFSCQAIAEGANGVYTDSAQGFAGEVTVTITVTDGVITDMTAEGPNETEGLGKTACEIIPQAVVESGSLAVDGMTGASFTSQAIFEAAEKALIAGGLDPESFKTEVKAEVKEDAVYDTDILIIGAGGAGMTAAITAADMGKQVIIVESQAIVGGNSIKSTGGMNAAKTPLQDKNEFGESAGIEAMLKSAGNYSDNEFITALAATVKDQWEAYQQSPEGYFDSVELMELDTMIGGKGINDPELVKALCEGSADAISWLAEQDINLTSVGAFGGASVKRIHRPVNDEGKTISVGTYVVPLLEKACDARDNVTILFETTANKLLTDEDGKVIGAECTGSSGEKVTVNASAVVLATGGFGANLDMVSYYKPELEGFMTTNSPGILGQGIVMAQEIGAAVVDLDQIQIHPTVQFDTASLITEGLRGDGAILVNAEGKRFIDEVGTRDVVSAAEIAQPGSFSWLVVDDAMLQASSVIQGYVNRGFVFSGETYEELAEAIGVPADVFAATMADWNEKVANKEDADFGRTSFANPLDTSPYYAIKVTAGIHHTMGGLAIDTSAEVLNTEGEAIEGLFAAGEVTGGVHGANRLGGNAVADFTVFGRIAGNSAAEYAK